MGRMKVIEIFGDKYKIRKTYDIDEFGMGYYGFDIYDEDNKFMSNFIGDNINVLKQYIKIIFYKNYESPHYYNE